jgi:hypothetical protein
VYANPVHLDAKPAYRTNNPIAGLSQLTTNRQITHGGSTITFHMPTFDLGECLGDLALTESRVIIREGCRTLPAKRVVTVELCLIDSQRYSADSFARRSKYRRARRANRRRRFRPDTPGHYVFRNQSLVRYPPTDSLVPKRNDRQKIELNVEILEGHLGCMKSTHSMNAATWGR